MRNTLHLASLVEGKTVAVVGNAKSLLKGDKFGSLIDKHDIVIRMNAGLPGVLSPDYVGERTDVWATAKFFGRTYPKDARLMVFMKLTRIGNRDWKLFKKAAWWETQSERWTQELEDEVKDFVGADPGTGIRILYYLKRHCAPKTVNVYGMDCWETLSSWSNRPNTPNHHPLKEKEALLRLLSE